jgi:hypothetical protein
LVANPIARAVPAGEANAIRVLSLVARAGDGSRKVEG